MENDIDLIQKLEVMRTEVEKELTNIAIHNPLSDDWEITTTREPLHESDSDLLADAAEAADEQERTLAELENSYKAIVRALANVKAGTYGLCEISGEMIEPERLRANPTARTCMKHMEDESRLPLL